MRLLTFLFLIVFSYSGFNQNSKIDSLWNLYNKAMRDTTKIRLSIILGIHLEQTNTDSAIKMYKYSIKLCDSILTTKITIEEIKSFKKYKAHLKNNLGIVYKNIGDIPKSLEYYHECLKIFENLNDSIGIANILHNIGKIYVLQGYIEIALDYYQKSLKIREIISDIHGISASLNNIGSVYYYLKDYDNAIEFYKKSIFIKEKINDKVGIAASLGNIGEIYTKKDDYVNALKYCEKSLNIQESIPDKQGIAISSNMIGKIYKKKKDFNKANFYFQKSLLKAKEIGYPEIIKETAIELDTIYRRKSDYKSAIKYLELYYLMNDSINNINTQKATIIQQAKYVNEKRAIADSLKYSEKIKIKELKLSEQNAIIKNERNQKYAFIIGLILMLLVAGILIYSFIIKRKANNLLLIKNIEIQLQKSEIESQRDQLQTSNLKLETLNSELEKLSIVASETDNSVVITNENGEIEWVNDGFTRLFGYTKDEFISLNSSNLKKASNNKDIENAIKECINKQKTVTYITLNRTKSGKSIWTQTTLTPIIKDNTLIKLVAIDSDISKLKQAEEEIKQQKEELQSQSELLMQTNCQLELKNTQITDSIRYAKQIQDAMLPDLSPKTQGKSIKSQVLKFGALNLEFETFILFRPKDIVSGDFYWFTKTKEFTFIAVADCTGHGVPGAFMSMIGNTLLNEIVVQKKIYNLAQILTKLDEGVNFAINKQQNLERTQEDGMEISICRIDFNKNEIQIASTNQSVYILNNNELNEIEGGIYSVGGGSFSNKIFETHKIIYYENAIIYLLSDGYQDQFGGENRKKFGSTNLKELIKSISEKSLEEQKTELENTFNSWKGNNKQIDDVTVIGIKI